MSRCPICDGENNPKNIKIMEIDSVLFYARNSVRNGHIQLYPKQHVLHLYDLSESDYIELFKYSRKLSALLAGEYSTDSVAIIDSGSVKSHRHINLIPVNSNDEIFNSNSELDDEEFRSDTDRLKKLLERMG